MTIIESSGRTHPLKASLHVLLLAVLGIVSLGACQRDAAPDRLTAQASTAEASPRAEAEIELSPAEIEKMGLTTAPATAAEFIAEAAGYAMVLSHDVVAQSAAELSTAMAAARQSRAVLARIHELAATPGAFPAETQETAERQAAADEAAWVLARRKLSAIWGLDAPWGEGNDRAVLDEVASGKAKLVRATFPLGALDGAHPRGLRFTRLVRASAVEGWSASMVWDAPADAAIPGRSLFALLRHAEVSEGERLDAWTAIGAAVKGVLIPRSAVVISEGEYRCYVELRPGHFAPRVVDASRPSGDGYFVDRGIAVGEPIVVTAVSFLLARETNPGAEAE